MSTQSERSEFIQLWTIQENLLQQYRSMSITLLGLLGAAILVLIASLFDHWKELHGVAYQFDKPLRQASVGMSIVLYILLLTLGIKGTLNFKRITAERSRFVTFYQNLLLAAESGQLARIKARHNIEGLFPSYTVAKAYLGSRSKTLLKFERQDHAQMVNLAEEILEVGAKAADDKERHHITRRFLKEFIYSVFFLFFVVCVGYLIVFLVHIFQLGEVTTFTGC